ncbi:transporter substrate-binding domain-containing protein [Pseudoduganella sp. FT25W]|uniref:Transporter substrate-binding domain-containing protein n=1 Tax=Duganella alba TaxID=2666081 RepID=A0A6L5QJG0_9BURK|nr:transporter substrate-binding domain-containing protein [Duganella alba]MRX09432.1 transporter substrate-binding domain-containing protein [Duganella alba]MRX17671.1 transporter substrate-binding domain-containing protein [Duganella alba]
MDRQAYTDWAKRAGQALIAAAMTAASPSAVAIPPPPLVVAVDTGTEMPMAAFRDNHLVDGFHKQLGEALAARLGREASFLLLPRKRIAMAMEAGQADVICLYLPSWLPGKFEWSKGFFPVAEVLVTDTSIPQPHKLQDIAGQPVATVLGYYYPELEKLGSGFVRDDGHSSSGNLRKMAAGRLHHAITQQSTLDYYLKVGEKLSLYPPFVIKSYKARCAVSPQGRVRLDEVNKAIDLLVKDGSVSKIISTYQNRLK